MGVMAKRDKMLPEKLVDPKKPLSVLHEKDRLARGSPKGRIILLDHKRQQAQMPSARWHTVSPLLGCRSWPSSTRSNASGSLLHLAIGRLPFP
jgi:hypothetical protein